MFYSILFFVYLICFIEQGPVGWQSLADSETEELSLLRDIYYVVNSSGHAQISATSWEAVIQRHIEEELYASSLEVIDLCLWKIQSCILENSNILRFFS